MNRGWDDSESVTGHNVNHDHFLPCGGARPDRPAHGSQDGAQQRIRPREQASGSDGPAVA